MQLFTAEAVEIFKRVCTGKSGKKQHDPGTNLEIRAFLQQEKYQNNNPPKDPIEFVQH